MKKVTPFPTLCPWCHKKPKIEIDRSGEGPEKLYWVICNTLNLNKELPNHNINVCDTTKEGAIIYWNKLVAR